MIIGIVTLISLMVGGGGFSFDVFKDAADHVIANKQIVRKIEAIAESADDELKAWNEDSKEISKHLAKMNQEYDLTPEELQTYLAYADSRREAFQEKLIQLRFQARNLMSHKEWDAMYARVEKDG